MPAFAFVWTIRDHDLLIVVPTLPKLCFVWPPLLDQLAVDSEPETVRHGCHACPDGPTPILLCYTKMYKLICVGVPCALARPQWWCKPERARSSHLEAWVYIS